LAEDTEKLPPPSAVFVMDFKKSTQVKTPPKSTATEVRTPSALKQGVAYHLVKSMEHRKFVKRTDFVPYYKPSDDIYGSSTGLDERPSLEDLSAITNTRVGCVFYATNGVSGDAMRNWHVFVDPDSQKEVRNKDTKAALDFASLSDLKNAAQQYLRYALGYGTSWLVKYWGIKNEIKHMEDPPKLGKPPRKFRAFSPRYMQPINVDKSNELNYEEDVWKFSGGELNYKYGIHQDRVDVLTLYPEEGSWRGLAIVEPVWIPLMGYFNSFIYLTKGLRHWGDAIPAMFTGDGLPEAGEITSVLDLMDEYQMNYKWALGKDDRLEFIQTKIGSGLKEAFEMYKEELSSAWRIPLNQLFGRSVGGGLMGAGALVSKEDYLQEISNKQMAMTDNIKKIYIDAGFKIESYDLLWNLAIKKTDEQRLKEEGMETQNKILTEQWRQAKAQTKLINMQVEAAEWQSLMPEQEGGGAGEGGEGEGKGGGEGDENKEEIDADQMEIAELTDLQKEKRKRFWQSIHIENHITFPYGGDRRY